MTSAPPELDRYTLLGELGSGGMATVYLARMTGAAGFQRDCAVKRMHPHLLHDLTFVAMFRDEARLAARLRHPNIVQTLDVVARDGELLLVMEYIEGEALSKLLTFGAVPLTVASAVISNALHGLHYAHEASGERGKPLGIVHRDVSPHNVLVGTDGVARVIDFGVAKAADRLQITVKGELKGKLAYMAPEQLAGETVDRRTDVYAAGIVLWEALTGRRCFDGTTDSAMRLGERIPAPSSLNPAVPPELDALVARAMRSDPAARFATARELAVALERCVRPATPYEVGEWVASVAADSVKNLRRLVAPLLDDDPRSLTMTFTGESGIKDAIRAFESGSARSRSLASLVESSSGERPTALRPSFADASTAAAPSPLGLPRTPGAHLEAASALISTPRRPAFEGAPATAAFAGAPAALATTQASPGAHFAFSPGLATSTLAAAQRPEDLSPAPAPPRLSALLPWFGVGAAFVISLVGVTVAVRSPGGPSPASDPASTPASPATSGVSGGPPSAEPSAPAPRPSEPVADPSDAAPSGLGVDASTQPSAPATRPRMYHGPKPHSTRPGSPPSATATGGPASSSGDLNGAIDTRK